MTNQVLTKQCWWCSKEVESESPKDDECSSCFYVYKELRKFHLKLNNSLTKK